MSEVLAKSRSVLTGNQSLWRLRITRLPASATSLLGVGGGRGWYSAAICQRHPKLTATVLDLPGSAAVGREIIAAAGMSDRVRHRDGDVTMGDLGSGYDAVRCGASTSCII
jgi:hypothetical protein